MRFIQKIIAVVAAAGVVAFGVGGAATAFAEAPDKQAASHSRELEVAQGGQWLPWDQNNITTMAKCEARLKKLRAVNDWMNLSNSKCTRVKLAQCPPKSVYWVMVLDHGAGSRLAAPVESRELALAC